MFIDPLVEQAAVPNVPRLYEKHWSKEALESFDSGIAVIRQEGIDLRVLNELQHAKVENWCKTSGPVRSRSRAGRRSTF